MQAPTTLHLALLSAAVLGLRHGFDYDHIAAISDITSVEQTPAGEGAGEQEAHDAIACNSEATLPTKDARLPS